MLERHLVQFTVHSLVFHLFNQNNPKHGGLGVLPSSDYQRNRTESEAHSLLAFYELAARSLAPRFMACVPGASWYNPVTRGLHLGDVNMYVHPSKCTIW